MPRAEAPRDRLAGWARWFPILLAAAAMAAYANSLSAPFVFDDIGAIVENPHIERLLPLSRSLAAPSQSTVSGRPAISLSLALNYAIGGRRVDGYHLVNIAIHILAALALFGIVRRTLATTRLREHWGRSASGIAMAASLLWMLHPLQTAAVTYVVQRAESMMALSYLLTLYCFIRSAEAERRGVRGGWLAAAVAASLVGMASKEVMATAPACVLLYDRVFLSRSWKETIRLRGAAHAALWATLGLLAFLVAGGARATSAGFSLETMAPLDYGRAQFGVVLHYLRLSLVPHPLVFDYAWTPVRSWGPALAPMLGVVALLGVTVWALWRHPAAGYAAFCFFLILAPTSTVVPIADLAFEHRMYLPLASLMVLGTVGGAALLRYLIPGRDMRLRTAIAVVGALALVYGGLTVRRNHDYRTAETLWEDVIAKRPQNPTGYNNLGVLLVERNERVEEAIANFRMALKLRPNYLEAHYNLGRALEGRGQVDEAIAQYQEALKLNPGHAEARNNLGVALARRGQVDEAIPHFESALRIQPDGVEAHYNLGLALASRGQMDEAIPHLQTTLRIRPDHVEAHYNLGVVLAGRGRVDEAIVHYQEALRLKPDYAEAFHNLAWIRATCSDPKFRDGPQAVSLASRAVELSASDAHALDALAAAYAEAGRFDEAVQGARRAVELATQQNEQVLANAIQARIRLYRAGMPFHETPSSVTTTRVTPP